MGAMLRLMREIPADSEHSDTSVGHPGQQWSASVKALCGMAPLRILLVLGQQPGQTGSGVYLREVVAELQNQGHEPHLLAAHYRPLTSDDFPSLRDGQIHTVVYCDGRNKSSADIGFAIPGMSLDMPYLHLPYRELSESMLEQYCLAWSRKLGDLIKRIEPHIVHVNHLWLLPGIARTAAPWLPIVATAHGTAYKLLQDKPAFADIVSPGVQSLDAIMPISENTCRQAVQAFDALPERMHVTGNGYNPRLFRIMDRDKGSQILRRLLTKCGRAQGVDRLVLYVGKFADYKGIPYLVKAAGLYGKASGGEVTTLIVGAGSDPYRKRLMDLVASLGLQGEVLMPGKVPYHEVGALMNMADVFVLPSIDEPFGLVLLEALACGIPSVAADRGGPPSFVPEQIVNRGLASLVKPLKLVRDQEPDGDDEMRYARDIAGAVQPHLVKRASRADRAFIASTVKIQTWAIQVERIVKVYAMAIESRISQYSTAKERAR